MCVADNGVIKLLQTPLGYTAWYIGDYYSHNNGPTPTTNTCTPLAAVERPVRPVL